MLNEFQVQSGIGVNLTFFGGGGVCQFSNTSPALVTAENYERLEADKKKHVQKKRRCVGPTIRYHCVTMPLVTDLSMKEENVDVEG